MNRHLLGNLDLLLNRSVHLKHKTLPVAICFYFFPSPSWNFGKEIEVTSTLWFPEVELVLLLVLYRYVSVNKHMCQLLGKVHFFSWVICKGSIKIQLCCFQYNSMRVGISVNRARKIVWVVIISLLLQCSTSILCHSFLVQLWRQGGIWTLKKFFF